MTSTGGHQQGAGAAGVGSEHLFVRTEAAWRELGAPESMWDEIEAAKAWQTYAKPERQLRYLDPTMALLDGADEMPPPTVDEVCAWDDARLEAARNWHRAVAWYVLARHNALTDDELRQVERYRPQRWLADLADPSAVEAHLFGRDQPS